MVQTLFNSLREVTSLWSSRSVEMTALRTKVRLASIAQMENRVAGPSTRRSELTTLALLLACLLLLPAMSFAATGGTANLPLPQPPPPPGKKVTPNPRAMTIKLDTTWVECNGYRPVRVTITPTPPLTVDRTVTLRIQPRGWSGGQPMITMTQDVEVPAGAASVSAVMAVPQMEAWNTFAFDVFDDGVPVPELSVPMHRVTNNSNNNYWGDWGSPNILMLGAPKRADVLFSAFGRSIETSITTGLQPAIITSGVVATPVVAGKFTGVTGIPSHADLPTRWIDYSGLDIVYIELPELTQFVQDFPEQWRAIRQWVDSGGNLWVGGLGRRWQRVSQLEKLLELPSFSDDKADPPGWTAPDPAKRTDTLEGLGRNYGQAVAAVAVDASVNTSSQQETPLFRTRALGRGQVTVFGHDDPLTELKEASSWNWVFNSLGAENWSWYRRHGLSLHRDNFDFWNFLIPGVGLAPVTEFQVLITLFVLAIGPLNFFLLRRWRKLNLIVITVPLSALAVTGALLLYALVADGLSIRARGRSFTEIDQRRGQAVCWARLSYYAGLRPSQGLAFGTDTAVYSIDHEGRDQYYRSNRQRRTVDWGEKQYLSSGWLNARTPTQLLTVSVRPSEYKLQVLETGSSPPVVQNLLGTRIEKLTLIDSKGQAYQASDVDQDAKVTLTPSTTSDNTSQLWQAFNRNQPQRPEGMNGDSYGLFGVRRRYVYYGQSYDMDAAVQRTSVLERSLQSLSNPQDYRHAQPRSYFALVERSPEMTFGLDSVKEEAGFHVIYGRW